MGDAGQDTPVTTDAVLDLMLAYGTASREWARASTDFQWAGQDQTDEEQAARYEERVTPSLHAAMAAQTALQDAVTALGERAARAEGALRHRVDATDAVDRMVAWLRREDVQEDRAADTMRHRDAEVVAAVETPLTGGTVPPPTS